ncbi:MAG: hypothetical protein ACI9RM_001727, partial [Ulvibacter sp.]
GGHFSMAGFTGTFYANTGTALLGTLISNPIVQGFR